MVTVQYNPFTPETHADPYPMYRALRETDPVHWSPLLESWVLTRYRDVSAALADARLSAERQRSTNRMAQRIAQAETDVRYVPAPTMLNSDPPAHTRLRGLVNKAFTPRAVERLRPAVERIVGELLDAAAERGRMDIIDDLAFPLPVMIIARMLGIPPEEREQFKRWSDDIANVTGPLAPPELLDKAFQSGIELNAYFREVIAERRRHPGEDLVSALIAAEEQGQVLSEQELVSTCILLLVAGNETTTNLIGNGMLALLRDPDQARLLRDDLSLTHRAVEEMLRYDGPVQGTARVALEDMEIDRRPVQQGQLVMIMLAAADRDPEQFPDPERLDILRPESRHVAFGYGIHFCLGAPLARLEGQIAIEALVRRFPRMELAGDVRWGGSFILRGLKQFPVSL